ncbi:hypothetical protein SMICM304S_08189 [Streptomyces microflavus]
MTGRPATKAMAARVQSLALSSLPSCTGAGPVYGAGNVLGPRATAAEGRSSQQLRLLGGRGGGRQLGQPLGDGGPGPPPAVPPPPEWTPPSRPRSPAGPGRPRRRGAGCAPVGRGQIEQRSRTGPARAGSGGRGVGDAPVDAAQPVPGGHRDPGCAKPLAGAGTCRRRRPGRRRRSPPDGSTSPRPRRRRTRQRKRRRKRPPIGRRVAGGRRGARAGPVRAPLRRARPRAASAEEAAPAGGAATDDAGFEPYDFLPTDPWHEKRVREARWASLKQSSGGLMADFPARVPAAPRAEEPPAEAADRKGREDGVVLLDAEERFQRLRQLVVAGHRAGLGQGVVHAGVVVAVDELHRVRRDHDDQGQQGGHQR